MEQIKLMSWILLGLGCAKLFSAISQTRVDSVRRFAFGYLAPCLFFSSVYRSDLENLPSFSVFATYILCFTGLFLGVRAWLVSQRSDSLASSNIKAISALYPNAVGVGGPLVLALYGAKATLVLMGIIVTNLLLVLPLVNILMIRSGEQGFYSYRKVATDPILLGIVSGLLLNVWGVGLPVMFIDGLSVIGAAAIPIILFILGASLSFYSFGSLVQEKLGLLLIIKILLFPLLVLICAQYVFSLSVIETQVLVLLASLPTGLNVYLLSERYQVAKEATAGVILFTTGFSLITLFGWELLLQQWVA
ncbi:AEC family transporter [Vibrio sp. J1-1]|uniref:AEC family transporter n=1 Tax=Vibrio sp. J1-1 TaxID=2912251 RepID=UPI001F024D99|nr:AEC family transporter [Vibrio sp. J1-1]MCF7481516.1 AEC family transporter [Vibrio sp. J1-1]